METIRARGPEAEEAQRRYNEAVNLEASLSNEIERRERTLAKCESMSMIEKQRGQIDETRQQLVDVQENMRLYLKIMRGEIATFSTTIPANRKPVKREELIDAHLRGVSNTGRSRLSPVDLEGLSERSRDVWTVELGIFSYFKDLSQEIAKTQRNMEAGAFKHTHGFRKGQEDLLVEIDVYARDEYERLVNDLADAMGRVVNRPWMAEGRTSQLDDADDDADRVTWENAKAPKRSTDLEHNAGAWALNLGGQPKRKS